MPLNCGMPLTTGSRFGPYEIVSPLGAGGMGEVYRARDTRLDRTVALKVLNSQLPLSAELKQRFEREARAISSLNHPNICTLYDIGQQDGVDFLVMEYLEGESLTDRLKRGALPVDELLRIGSEISDALHKAHRAGIIHRDLKPGNIMLTKSGAKLLDFGLAKPIAAATAVAPSSNSVFSAAMTRSSPDSPLSTAGTVLGTVQYMSPEQITGGEADARSDIFALGLVLYEMTAGKHAFTGKNQASVAGAILAVEPSPVSSLQPTTPAALDQVVRICLAKDPEERYQSAHDVKLQLEWIRSAGRAGSAPTQIMHRSIRERVVWTSTALVMAALLLGAGYFARTSQPAQAVVAQIPPPKDANFALWGTAPGLPALSPDGKQLAFVASTSDGRDLVYVRSLDSLNARALERTDGAQHLSWSPDGRFLAYSSKGKLYRIDAAGGPPLELSALNVTRAAWNRDGSILVSIGSAGAPGREILRIPASGGEARSVAKLSYPVGSLQFLPDGTHFLIHRPGEDSGTYVASLSGGEPKLLIHGTTPALYALPGYLLFLQDGTLMAQKFDTSSMQLSGAVTPLAENVFVNSVINRGIFSVSENGTLVYEVSSRPATRILFYDRSGKQTPGPEGLGPSGSPSLSPDGTKLAFSMNDRAAGKVDIWVQDLARGMKTRLTFSSGINADASWMPDGKNVSFLSNQDGRFHIYTKPADGTGNATPLFIDDAAEFFPSWSADGRYVAFQRNTGARLQSAYGPASGEIWAMPLFGERKPFPVVQNGQFVAIRPALSPNAKWLAYISDESGQQEIYIVPFPHGSGRWQVSSGGGNIPRWSRDGKEIFYLAPGNQLMSARVAEQNESLEVGQAQPLFQVSPAQGSLGPVYDVSADGKKFVVLSEDPHERFPPFTLVLNWPALLNKQP